MLFYKLRDARKAAGVTQEELAEALSVNRATISKYETGQIEPSITQLQTIANKLGVHLFDLVGMGGDTPAGYEYQATVTLQNMRELYDTLPEADKAEFWRLAKGGEPRQAPANTKKEAPSELSEEALKVAHDYTELDQPGKNVVRVVVAEEGKRVRAEKERRQVAIVEPTETRYIPLYYTPAAAGMSSPAMGQDFDYIEVGNDVPRQADFAVKIDGESMEPYIRDRSTVYVNREPLENGDVGIFYVDGDMLCKQYYKDDYGNVHLLSLNRNYSHSDRFINARDSDTVFMYYGRVILPRRPLISLL